MKKIELTKTMSKLNCKIKKNAPEILAVTGVIGITVSAVMACKATTKLSGILAEAEEELSIIHSSSLSEKAIEKGYNDTDLKKDLTIVYVQTGVKVAKLYVPSVMLGVFSIGSMLTSNNILRKRNMALALAYTTVDKGFKEYRSRVVERFGEDVDKSLRFNTVKKKIDTIEIDPETGKEKKVKKEIDVINGESICEYARMFNSTTNAFDSNHSYNDVFLRAQQSYMNDILKSRGHLFLNEVYDALGFPRTKVGQIVGWVYNTTNPVGDNYVDFNITEVFDEEAQDYRFMLDFNVDGNVLDLMD